MDLARYLYAYNKRQYPMSECLEIADYLHAEALKEKTRETKQDPQN